MSAPLAAAKPLRCRRCVLGLDVPGTRLDREGVCHVCRQFERFEQHAQGYFKDEEALRRIIQESRPAARGDYDVLLLYSGGKDSAYALSRLLELGARVKTFTFDNDYISPTSLQSIRDVCAALHVPNVMARLDNINALLAESIRKEAGVCPGCFRAVTLLSTRLALDEGIPIIMTGLGRGQIYETKLHQLYEVGIFDEAEVERMTASFRKAYHRRADRMAQLIGVRVLDDEAAFDRLKFLDFFRYSAVTKGDLRSYLTEKLAQWKLPTDTGSLSTNCTIDDVGIRVHQQRRGYHVYAVSLSWEVRVGHTTRAEALEKVEARLDVARVDALLAQIGVKDPW